MLQKSNHTLSLQSTLPCETNRPFNWQWLTDSQQTQNIGMNVFLASQRSAYFVGQSALSWWRECVFVFANNMPALFAFFCKVTYHVHFLNVPWRKSCTKMCCSIFVLFLQLFTPFVIIQHQDSDQLQFTVAGSCLLCDPQPWIALWIYLYIPSALNSSVNMSGYTLRLEELCKHAGIYLLPCKALLTCLYLPLALNSCVNVPVYILSLQQLS